MQNYNDLRPEVKTALSMMVDQLSKVTTTLQMLELRLQFQERKMQGVSTFIQDNDLSFAPRYAENAVLYHLNRSINDANLSQAQKNE